MWELLSSTKAKQQHKCAESIVLQLGYITKKVGLPQSTPQIRLVVSVFDFALLASAQSSVPGTDLTWYHIKIRFSFMSPTPAAGVTSFLCSSVLLPRWFSEPSVYSRDGEGETAPCRNSSLLQTWARPESKNKKEPGQVSLEGKENKGRKKKRRDSSSYSPVFRHNAHRDLGTQFFLLILCFCLLGCSSRTQEIKRLNYWDWRRRN